MPGRCPCLKSKCKKFRLLYLLRHSAHVYSRVNDAGNGIWMLVIFVGWHKRFSLGPRQTLWMLVHFSATYSLQPSLLTTHMQNLPSGQKVKQALWSNGEGVRRAVASYVHLELSPALFLSLSPMCQS